MLRLSIQFIHALVPSSHNNWYILWLAEKSTNASQIPDKNSEGVFPYCSLKHLVKYPGLEKPTE